LKFEFATTDGPSSIDLFCGLWGTFLGLLFGQWQQWHRGLASMIKDDPRDLQLQVFQLEFG
jgi:hypothetical protein